MKLPKRTITDVIGFCNRDLVPDSSFDAETQYHSEWFIDYFAFLGDKTLETQLGDAFYQARFMYKLMNALKLRLAKQRGIVKFQIVQYASICEAVLDTAISNFYKSEFEKVYTVKEYTVVPNALAKDTKIVKDGEVLTPCRTKSKKAELKRTRIDHKTQFAVDKGLITQRMKESVDDLYDLRNNIHILKAANSQYQPKLSEAKNAFLLMQDCVCEIKQFYEKQQV